MDLGTCRALGAMYTLLRRAFKIAGALGLWWQATSGILQGCPLSMILVNVPTTIWKWEVDSVPRRCARGRPPSPAAFWTRTRRRPWSRGPHSPSTMQAPAMLRWGGRAMRMTPRRWPWVQPPSRGRSPRWRSGCRSRAKTSAWTNPAPGSRGNRATGGPAPGVPIPLAASFHQLGVNVAIGGSRITGPLLSQRPEAGQSALRHLPHLSTYESRERAFSTLVTPLARYGVAVASVMEPNLRGLENAVVGAL